MRLRCPWEGLDETFDFKTRIDNPDWINGSGDRGIHYHLITSNSGATRAKKELAEISFSRRVQSVIGHSYRKPAA